MNRPMLADYRASPEFERWRALFYQPLCPLPGRDQGDPYILEVPTEARTAYPYYIYTSGETPYTPQAVDVYGWNGAGPAIYLGAALRDPTPHAHWAPCVRYIPGLPEPFVMLVSHSLGWGEETHVGHQIYRAHSRFPHGPFEYSGEQVTPAEDADFAIDADVYRTPEGVLKMAWATDFVQDEPLGTGIVEATINEELSALTGPPTLLARARSAWQVYEAQRFMPWKPVPGINWLRGDRVTWYTVEAPAGLTSPAGRRMVLYSGGCFWKDNYAVGVLAEEQGKLEDVTNKRGHFVIQSQPESRLYSLGHPSVFANGHFLLIHVRRGSVDAPRQMTIVPLLWNKQDLPYCPTQAELAAAGTIPD